MTWLALWQLSFARLLSALRLPAFWLAVTLLIGGSLGALILGHRALQEDQIRHKVASQQRFQLQTQLRVGPIGRAVDARLRVLRPPSALASWASGFDRQLGMAWDFGPTGEETLPPYPGSTLAGDVELDVELVVRLFGGILGVLFGVWVVQNERSSGWLCAEAATRTSPALLRLARLIGVWLVVALAVLIWSIGLHVASTYLSLETALPSNAMHAVAVGVAMYVGLMTAVGTLVGTRISSPSGAQSVALGIWAVWTVLLPQVVMVAAATTEAAVQFESAQREIGRDLYLAIEDEAARRVVSLIGFQASRLDIETKANGAFESIEAEWLRRMAEARRQLNSLREPYDQRREHQGKQWRLVAAVSPGFNLHALIAETLGTGPGAADAWLAAVAAHRRQLEEHLFDDRPTVPLRLTLDTGVEAWTYPRHDPIGFADLPQFHPPDPPPPNTLPWRLAVLNLLSLGALVAVCPTRP